MGQYCCAFGSRSARVAPEGPRPKTARGSAYFEEGLQHNEHGRLKEQDE